MNIVPRQSIVAAIEKARAAMPGLTDDQVFERVAREIGADPETVKAVATESSEATQ